MSNIAHNSIKGRIWDLFPYETLQGDCEIDRDILLAILPPEVSTCVTYMRLCREMKHPHILHTIKCLMIIWPKTSFSEMFQLCSNPKPIWKRAHTRRTWSFERETPCKLSAWGIKKETAYNLVFSISALSVSPIYDLSKINETSLECYLDLYESIQSVRKNGGNKFSSPVIGIESRSNKHKKVA